MKTINGSKFELTCREARSAIRKAPGVFAGVILIEGGDPTYIQVSKTTALKEVELNNLDVSSDFPSRNRQKRPSYLVPPPKCGGVPSWVKSYPCP